MSLFRKRQTAPAAIGDKVRVADPARNDLDLVPTYASAVGQYTNLEDVETKLSLPNRSVTTGGLRLGSSSTNSTSKTSRIVGGEDGTVNIDDVWREVRALERHNYGSSRYRKVGRTIEPVVDFLARFSPIVDMMVQGTSTASLVWGSLKGILMVAQTSIAYFYYVDNAMVKLGDVLSISAQYEKMFEKEVRVRTTLSDLYHEVYLFLEKIRKVLSVNSLKMFIKNVRKSFETEFKDNLDHIERYTRVFSEEVTLAHRKRMDNETKKIREMVGAVVADNAGLVWRADTKEVNETEEGVLSWLTQVDPSEDYHRALKRRASGTGVWIQEHISFKQWKCLSETSHDTSILWVHGRPGSGKTILSATTIEHLRNSGDKHPVAYFYCDSGDAQKRSTLNIMGSVLAQLVMQTKYLSTELLEAYGRAKKYGRRQISSADDITFLLKQILEVLPASYIIIDGIDECSDPSEVTRSFSEVIKICSASRLALFSRNLLTISKELQTPHSIELATILVQPDIEQFLTKSLDCLPGKETIAQERAFSKLSQTADGMFLYAALGIQSLNEAVDSQSMTDAVSSIPEGLNGVYGQILERLGSQSIRRRDLARKILLWVCCTTRPLSWKELQYALSWDDGREEFVEDHRPFKDAVLDLCAPLIEYRSGKDTFHMIHLSVREFLLKTHGFASMSATATQLLFAESSAHHNIAVVTIAALKIPTVVHSMHVDSIVYPLVKYATENWCYHLSSATFDSSLCKIYEDFVSSPLSRSTWILRFLTMSKQSYPLQRIAKYQKEVHDWKHHGASKAAFEGEDLADIQRALIDLDQIPLSSIQGETISGFERDLTVRDLARAYTMAGKVDQAIELFSNAITNAQQTLGVESTRITWLLNSLGIMYNQSNLTDLAVQTQLQALSIQEKYLPPNHPDIAITVNELGRMSRHRRCYEAAESYHLRALSILRKALPENDLQIIWTINTLARNYRFQRRYEEALTLHRQALKGQISLMGEEHPHPVRTKCDIARILQDQEKYKEALDGMKLMYEARVRLLGEMNPDTLWTMNNVGILWELLGDEEKAIEFQERAWRGQKEVLGVAHKHTLWTMKVLERMGVDVESL